ncbi:TPA: hypothetical protein ACIZC1_002606 [Enterococcus faecalis]
MKNIERQVLIQELVQFLEKKQKKNVLLVDYIQETKGSIHWTTARIQALYSAVYSTREVLLDYCYRWKNEQKRLFVLVWQR